VFGSRFGFQVLGSRFQVPGSRFWVTREPGTENPNVELRTKNPNVELRTENPNVELRTENPNAELRTENTELRASPLLGQLLDALTHEV
jgi:hypothetical protein